MNNTRISFASFFPISDISHIPTTIPQSKVTQSAEDSTYKQKYLQCKQNIKQFMIMVEKQFEQLTIKHNHEKQELKKQIARLKMILDDKNDVSDFTVRSKRGIQTNTKSQRSRSVTNQQNNSNTFIFQGISAFDQSKIHSKPKTIVDKNLSSVSTPSTLLDLQNALNSKKSSRVTSQPLSVSNLSNLNSSQNNSSSNVTQYTNQILKKTNQTLQGSNKKQNFDALMGKMIQKSISSQAQKEKAKFFQENDEKPCTERSLAQQKSQQNKQNFTGELSNRIDIKSKAQQTSVRNLLKNLRSSMKTNIEKQSNLEATTLITIKR